MRRLKSATHGLKHRGAEWGTQLFGPFKVVLEMRAQMEDLWAKVKTLREDMESLKGQLAEVNLTALRHRQVELIDLGDCRVFAYADDFITQYIRRDWRPAFAPKGDIAEELQSDDPLSRSIAFYVKNGLDFCHIDVGANYGLDLLRTTAFMKAYDVDCPVVAFEPGQPARLLTFTLLANELGEVVTVENMAASDRTTPVILNFDPLHSEDGRIVERDTPNFAWADVVRSVSLDDYVETQQLPENIIAKIDTQGAEPEVLAGMSRLLSRGRVVAICEFTPWAIRSRIEPSEFLRKIDQTHFLFDLGPNRERCVALDATDFESFPEHISGTQARWTDLLLVPRTCPELGELHRRFAADKVAAS